MTGDELLTVEEIAERVKVSELERFLAGMTSTAAE